MGRGVGQRLRAIVCALILALVWSGLPGAFPGGADVKAQDHSVRVPILVFHNVDYSGSAYSVTPEMLDAMCRWLIENGYTTITLWQFYEAAFSGAPLPPNPVLLTNDDGWSSAVVFAQTLGAYGLVGNYFINNYSPLTPDQIHVLALNGPVQAHTASHQYLSQLDYERQHAEIVDNKAYIEGITGQTVHFLAWPFGDVNASAAEAAVSAGMIAAFGLGGRPCYIGSIDAYHIPRIMVEATDDLERFAAKVNMWG